MNIKKVLLDNGEEIAYREREGGEKPILLIHGNMTSSKHWDLLMEAFDSNYKLYAVDLRGFGFSSYRNRIQAIKDFSDDVKGFVDAIGLKNFSIIGWSTGGAVAMQFEIDYPCLCKKMVLLASGSTRGYPMFETNEDGTANGERRLQSISDIEQDSRTIGMQYLYDSKDREGLKAVWNAVIYTDKRPDEMKYEEYIDDMLTQRNLADVYHALNTFNISSVDNGINKGTNEAALIEIPILVLYGDRDYVVTEQMTKEIIEDLGHVTRFIRLKNTGHSPMIDDLQQVKTEMEKFID
ncbi:alpha/beta fold hydrolase [Pseudogracilibacillus auburnensis]|uniref:Pimeloyl-ACP methyl ester carboxylesterase n=1 Tax=Pseudogracilibacillus auburnensis TaxID=1494959 RepID=A0A2V3WAP1_9BACI|nr:alpha/beta hydrolase [Pseudogracilibacillus auburnensis]MBO1003681.1 alpha/beta hydrolase [Pseudogracilibacillus auburnensis]PXW90308.1 pimeloyl-ACP methyl ester carboxylesterase [Pseudogracilibacillus auburnensis]